MNRIFLSLLLLYSCQFHSFAYQVQDILPYLQKNFPGASIKALAPSDHFHAEYEIMLPQPLDHNNPAVDSFQQRIFLSHYDSRQPVVFVTEGYNASNQTYELAKILRANQVIVEYRYFGASVPEKLDWAYLKNDQATEDLHRIRMLLKKLYRKKWLATGISKGGTTALIYKSKYPRDVKVTVPYVTPLARAQEDPRTDIHQATIGSAECRQSIVDVQRMALKQRDEIIPQIQHLAKQKGYQFSLGWEKVLEYAVLEFPFSFWQWEGNCAKLPDRTASSEEIFTILHKVVGFDFYSDQTCRFYLPSYYQFMTELGYYDFPTEGVEDLLEAVGDPSNLIFAPQEADLTFRHYLKPVEEFLEKKGKKIIYIYGELDTWTACGVVPNPKTKSLRMTKKGGTHSTRIKSFSPAERGLIYRHLKKWMKTRVYPLP